MFEEQLRSLAQQAHQQDIRPADLARQLSAILQQEFAGEWRWEMNKGFVPDTICPNCGAKTEAGLGCWRRQSCRGTDPVLRSTGQPLTGQFGWA